MNVVADKIDTARRRAAESLESAADSVRSAGDQGANALNDVANSAGKKLDSTAAYVRALPGRGTFTSLWQTVRRNPVGSLALATAIGLLAGIAYRRSGATDSLS